MLDICSASSWDFFSRVSIVLSVSVLALTPPIRVDAALEMMRADAGFHADQARRHIGKPFTPTRPPAENTAEKQRVRQQMLARNWHDDAISPELGSFCQKSHLIAGLIGRNCPGS
jgi:hypothetical protein